MNMRFGEFAALRRGHSGRTEVGRSVAGRLAGLALLAGPPYSGTRAATKVSRNCRRHFDLLFSNCRRKWPSQPRTPAIKSSNGVLSPRVAFHASPCGELPNGLFCLNSRAS
jgi:hypothetical protein